MILALVWLDNLPQGSGSKTTPNNLWNHRNVTQQSLMMIQSPLNNERMGSWSSRFSFQAKSSTLGVQVGYCLNNNSEKTHSFSPGFVVICSQKNSGTCSFSGSLTYRGNFDSMKHHISRFVRINGWLPLVCFLAFAFLGFQIQTWKLHMLFLENTNNHLGNLGSMWLSDYSI